MRTLNFRSILTGNVDGQTKTYHSNIVQIQLNDDVKIKTYKRPHLPQFCFCRCPSKCQPKGNCNLRWLRQIFNKYFDCNKKR